MNQEVYKTINYSRNSNHKLDCDYFCDIRPAHGAYIKCQEFIINERTSNRKPYKAVLVDKLLYNFDDIPLQFVWLACGCDFDRFKHIFSHYYGERYYLHQYYVLFFCKSKS